MMDNDSQPKKLLKRVMSFSFPRKLALGWSSLVILSLPVLAQSGFSPVNTEYPVAGALPGDQVMPSVSISSSGGYVVWQDNATDGDGWGISARALDSSLSAAFAPFRVNSTGKTDQENAKVALLKNGGAVFVWQGGRQGFQHIYARFLSPSNTWVGLDQMVNASTKVYQGNPAVAVLENGNVVIVYASFNTNTMQDVHGQIFTPAGKKIGSEFQINNTTPFNQRSPVVAATTKSGFVAAWISEQQRAIGQPGAGLTPPSQFVLPSVDVYGRLFEANGIPAHSEFVVNSGSNVCANPSVTAVADGAVIFAWSGADSQVRHNSWDVYARAFTFSPSAIPFAGLEQRVNVQLYGDQFAPKLSSQETNVLMVWTSLGQDGSAAGVYGQALNADGSRSGGEFRLNATVFASQKEPATAADGNGRFLTAWTSPTYGSSRNDLFAQQHAALGSGLSSPVVNYGAPAFVGEAPILAASGVTNGHYLTPHYEAPSLDYPGAISYGSGELPATNAFAAAAGAYSGLFYDPNGVSPASAGAISVTVKKDKTFTGSLTIGGKSYSIGSGKFSDLGVTDKVVVRSGLSPLLVSMRLDLFGGKQIQGTVKSGGTWSSVLLADRQATNASAFAGSYTVIVPAAQTGPVGSGYATLTNKASGSVTFVGKMADGTTVTRSGTLSQTGIFPLYYNASGVFLMGWLQFNPISSSDRSGGDIVWIRSKQLSSKPYPAGFTNEVSAIAALRKPAVPGIHQLNLSSGGINPALDFSIQVGSNNKITNLSAMKVGVTLKNSGAFSGSTTIFGKTVSFGGVLLEGGSGEGFFMNANQSGKVTFE
jgi:hypothetical protein